VPTDLPTWLDIIRTAAAVAVPVVVAWLAYRLNSRAKRWEANQWRNQELIRARLAYYQDLAPKLNDLMCYFTFVGGWKELTPPRVIALKRDVDRLFYSASPLFSAACSEAYDGFMEVCFATFGNWGNDAKLRTGFLRRRQAAPQHWDEEWEQCFTHAEDQHISVEELHGVRTKYDRVLAALAEDIQLLEARDRYVSERISINAF
jgi:hypothetical protein